ncbi:MAG TPA: DUF488 domain-containing protein [Phycisphaerae bacterium]|nr:DUF488 domain-containing protein [Phycisphaerae bacterium]HNU46240.1 DUF488 domain-containing protein [Phycisphaerae bacterium]
MSALSTIWTVGHSSVELDDLFRLLRRHDIEMLVDVRSTPYSRYAPQANREVLERACADQGLAYRYRGEHLGGRPADPACRDAKGNPDYEAVRQTPAFSAALAALVADAYSNRLCLLCAEEDPARCHRTLLVGKALTRTGHEVLHLRHDGSVETQAEVERRRTGGQLTPS